MSIMGGFSEESLEKYQDLLKSTGEVDELYDFTRCVTPQGEVYGTKGRCLPPNRLASQQGSDPKFDTSLSTRSTPKERERARQARENMKKDPKGWGNEQKIRDAENIRGGIDAIYDPKAREEVSERLKRAPGYIMRGINEKFFGH